MEKKIKFLEVEPSSNSKPRMSRLQQPRKYTLTPLKRSNSVENLNNRQSNSNSTDNIPRSITKRSRSCMMTPIKTPFLQRYFSTPQQQQQYQQQTAESEKRLIADKSHKILNYIKNNPNILPSDISAISTIKSLSTKQCLSLITALIQSLAGKRFNCPDMKPDDILKMLNNLKYPYIINKSFLVTPMAPHSYSYTVYLLDWLIERAIPMSSTEIDAFEQKFINHNSFNNRDFALLYLKESKRNFIFWNKPEEHNEHELSKNYLLDELIRFLVNDKNINSKEEFEREINRLKHDCEMLEKNRVILKHKDEYELLEKTVKNLRDENNELIRKHTERSDKLAELQLLLESKIDKQNKIKDIIENIKTQIKSQKMSVEQRNDLIDQLNHKRNIVNAKKSTILELNNMGITNQIERSRLLKHKTHLIAEINKFIYTVFQKLQVSSIDEHKIGDLHLSDELTNTEFEEKLHLIETILIQIKNDNLQKKIKYAERINEFEIKIKTIIKEIDSLKSKQNGLLQQKEKLVVTIDSLDTKIINSRRSNENRYAELTNSLKRLNAEMEQQELKITDKQRESVQAKEQNEALVVELEERAEAIFKIKRKNLAEYNGLLKEMDEKLNKTLELNNKTFELNSRK